MRNKIEIGVSVNHKLRFKKKKRHFHNIRSNLRKIVQGKFCPLCYLNEGWVLGCGVRPVFSLLNCDKVDSSSHFSRWHQTHHHLSSKNYWTQNINDSIDFLRHTDMVFRFSLGHFGKTWIVLRPERNSYHKQFRHFSTFWFRKIL